MIDLTELLNRYISHKRGEGLKPHTLVMYRDHISRFVASLPPDRRVLPVAVADVAAFLSAEEERGMGVITRRARHRAIDVWLNWMADQDDLVNPANPLRRADGSLKLKPPRKPKHKPRRADIDDLKRVIDSIKGVDWVSLRDKAMLLLALDSGLRVGELVGLGITDIDVRAKTVHVHDGKGDKERMAAFTNATASALMLYLLARPFVDVSEAFANRLFLASYTAVVVGVRGALTVSGAQQRLKVLCAAAGVPGINWHSIRHLFGTKAINDGLRAETVSLLMGHSDVAFTRRIYAELLPATAVREYAEKWK